MATCPRPGAPAAPARVGVQGRVCTQGMGSVPRLGAQTWGNRCLPAPALPRLQWETVEPEPEIAAVLLFPWQPRYLERSQNIITTIRGEGERGEETLGLRKMSVGAMAEPGCADSNTRTYPQPHPPRGRHTRTHVCVHTHDTYTLVSPTCTRAKITHAHACTPAVRALARGRVRSAVTGSLTRGQALRRHPTADNRTTAEMTAEGTTGTTTGRGTG